MRLSQVEYHSEKMTEALLYWALKKNHSQTRGAAALVDLLAKHRPLDTSWIKIWAPSILRIYSFAMQPGYRIHVYRIWTHWKCRRNERAKPGITVSDCLQFQIEKCRKFEWAEKARSPFYPTVRRKKRKKFNILRWGSTARCSNQKRCKNWSMTTIQKPKSKHYSTLDHWNVFMEMHWSKICADCKDLGLHPHATQKLNDANCTFRNATSLRGNKRGWVISTSTCTVPVALFLSCIYMSCISQI